MSVASALLFPATQLSSHHLPLLLLFRPLLLLASGALHHTSRIKDELSAGCCHFLAPPSLGEPESRWQQLLADITAGGAAEQLARLTLAARHQSGRWPEEAASGLARNLRQMQPSGLDTAQEELWQARLVLAIAAHLDRQEEQLASQLRQLDRQQQQLFTSLHGEDSDITAEETELPLPGQLSPAASSTTAQLRLRAWSRLLASHHKAEERIWVTDCLETQAFLLDRYASQYHQPASWHCSLPLPASLGDHLQPAAAIIEDIPASLSSLAQQLPALLSAFDDQLMASFIDSWQQGINHSFPARQYGRAILELHHLAAAHCSSLLPLPSPHQSGTILACLQRQQ